MFSCKVTVACTHAKTGLTEDQEFFPMVFVYAVASINRTRTRDLIIIISFINTVLNQNWGPPQAISLEWLVVWTCSVVLVFHPFPNVHVGLAMLSTFN